MGYRQHNNPFSKSISPLKHNVTDRSGNPWEHVHDGRTVTGKRQFREIKGQSTFGQKADKKVRGRTEREIAMEYANQLAEIMIYPSIFEGFGIPILEALTSKTPVITSNVSSMPEICGDSGLIVDPLNVIEIANAMQKIKNDKNLCNKLIESGIKRSQIFNWNESAKNFSKVIEKYI